MISEIMLSAYNRPSSVLDVKDKKLNRLCLWPHKTYSLVRERNTLTAIVSPMQAPYYRGGVPSRAGRGFCGGRERTRWVNSELGSTFQACVGLVELTCLNRNQKSFPFSFYTSFPMCKTESVINPGVYLGKLSTFESPKALAFFSFFLFLKIITANFRDS